jgi:nitrite reductase (NO-forming)
MRLSRLILASGVVLATACGTAGPATAPVAAVLAPNGVQQVTVRVAEGMRFEPSAIVVKAGQPVRLTLENRTGAEHDFTLDEGVSSPVKIVARGQQSAVGSFTIERPGSYEFYCSVPGHAMAGMRGTVTVQ